MALLDRYTDRVSPETEKSATEKFFQQISNVAGFIGAIVFGPYVVIQVNALADDFISLWGDGSMAALIQVVLNLAVGAVIFLSLRRATYLLLLGIAAVVTWAATGGGFFSRGAVAVF